MEAKLRYRRSEKGLATIRAYNSKYYTANRLRLIHAKVMYTRNRQYGVTNEQYEAQLALQGGVCKVCLGINQSGRRLAVDHDHETKVFRGLLCDRCNRGIGYFRDSPELLSKAMEYLCRIQK